MATKESVSKLDEQVAIQSARGWNPKEGDRVAGTILAITASQPGQYGIYPIVTIRKGDGELVALHAFHHTLQRRLVQLRPVAGETLVVQYNGEREGKTKDGKGKARTYNDYAVVVDRPEDTTSASWDMFGTDEDDDESNDVPA